MDAQVVIVGAGPTGLTLATDLGLRGVRCVVLEQKPAPQFLPKMERCNARSMEIYRRMGIADRIRAAGLPGHNPMDVFIVLSLAEPPLYHLPTLRSTPTARRSRSAKTRASRSSPTSSSPSTRSSRC
jgi:2-polyprenyl-6-methoxyphenol hydroxylase-like FAD-dependent oxidoreductase